MFESREADVVERYRRRYSLQDLVFGLTNRLSGAWARLSDKNIVPPRRILICNIGALGDILITTALLAPLRAAFPGVEIGVLTTAESAGALAADPSILAVHVVKHWSTALRNREKLRDVVRHAYEYFARARQLRALRYDMAIDARMWFPGSTLFLYVSGIPIRVGFGRLGFAGFLTHAVRFTYDRRHEVEHQFDLLRAVGIDTVLPAHPRSEIASAPADAREKVRSLVEGWGHFRILHPGSSSAIKDWPIVEWRRLAQHLLARGIKPVVTGRGARDRAIVESVVAGVAGAVDACDKFSWNELVAVIERADAVYSVDTSIGHLAAALGRPVISIFGGMSDPARWAPLNGAVATNSVACSPCLNKLGCATRDCLTGLTVFDVERVANARYGI